MNRAHAAGILAIVVAMLLAPSAPGASVASAQLESNNFQLAVIPISSHLPADSGNSFVTIQLQTAKDDKPMEAPYDVEVTLSTSDASIIAIQEKVVIPKGESMVTTSISTTSKAGNAELTALAEGVGSGIAPLSTMRLDSLEPSKLAVYAGSGSFVPDPAFVGKLYVQLLNSADIPAPAKAPVIIYLSSSDPRIGTVPKQVTVAAGNTGATVNFVPTYRQGSVTITADANGFAPGTASITTAGPVGAKLVVEFAPLSMPAPVGYFSAFTVQIRDTTDIPVKASQKTTIMLSSSDTRIAKVPAFLTIEPGSSYALGKIESGGQVGSATITASTQGLVSGFGTITTFEHFEGDQNGAKRMNAYVVPSNIVPDNSEEATIVVQATDISGRVYTSQYYHYHSVTLSSSDPNVGAIVNPSLHSDMTFATTQFKSSFYQGKTTITVSKDGYASGQAAVNTKGSVPAALVLSQMPELVVANGKSSASVIATLLDDKGRPVPTQSDIFLSLSSSNPEVATVEPSEAISAGKSSVQIEVQTTTKAGESMITAKAEGLAPSSVTFRTVGNTGESSPYNLSVSAIPMLPADGKSYEAVYVQLRDANGNLVPAKEDVSVTLSSSSRLAGTVESPVVIEKGSSFKVAKFVTGTSPAKYEITASSRGFATVEAEQETTVQPLAVLVTSQIPREMPFAKFPVSVQVYSGSILIGGANVDIGGTHANVTRAVTDDMGRATSDYVPTLPGDNSVIVTVTKPGYEQKVETEPLSLEQAVNIHVGAMTEHGNPVQLQVKLQGPDGTDNLTVESGQTALMAEAEWGLYTITVPDELAEPDATYKFDRWSDGATENPRTINIVYDSTITAVYSAQYLLSVSSVKGAVGGGGYVPEGETAVISVTPSTIGGTLIDSSFDRWSGGIQSTSPTTEVVMDGPKTIKAEWKDNYVKLLGLLAAAGGGGFVAYYKVVRPKRVAQAKARAPDLDWYKS